MHGRTIFARLVGQFARSKRCAGKTIASRFSADIKDWIANAACRAARQLFVTQYAEAKNIYQRIALEAFIEIDFTANGRDPDAISVMRDSGDDACEQAGGSPLISDLARVRRIRISKFHRDWSKAQRVQAKFRACAHRKDIADDSADAGGCALEGSIALG